MCVWHLFKMPCCWREQKQSGRMNMQDRHSVSRWTMYTASRHLCIGKREAKQKWNWVYLFFTEAFSVTLNFCVQFSFKMIKFYVWINWLNTIIHENFHLRRLSTLHINTVYGDDLIFGREQCADVQLYIIILFCISLSVLDYKVLAYRALLLEKKV